jgi:hypothetical protein
MSRDITSGFRTEIEANQLSPMEFIKAEFETETIRFWSGGGSKVFRGETYTGAGNLIKISEVVETEKNEANGSRVSLSGIPTRS